MNYYKEIIKIINNIGSNSRLDNVLVKVIDLEKEILVYNPATGWLAKQKRIEHKNQLTGQVRFTYSYVTVFKDENTPYVLKDGVIKLYEEIIKIL